MLVVYVVIYVIYMLIVILLIACIVIYIHCYFFIFFIFFLFFLTFIYFWDRERQSMNTGGAERERERHRIQNRLQALSSQHRARRGARTHGLRDRDLSRSQMLNWPSHPGAPGELISKQMCRSMEQNRDSRNRPTHISTMDF